MVPGGPFEGTLETPVEEVGEQENDGPAVQNAIEIVEPFPERRAPVPWLKEQDIANEAEYVPGAFARRHEPLHTVRAGDEAHFVIIADRAEGEHGCQLGHHFSFLLELRSEVVTGAAVDEQHHRQFPFLNVALDEWMPHAGGHIPIDRADIVSGLVGSNLLERKPHSL